MEYKYHDFKYKRHMTLEQAEAFKTKWEHEDENERTVAKIQYKRKTDDYTVVCIKWYN